MEVLHEHFKELYWIENKIHHCSLVFYENCRMNETELDGESKICLYWNIQ